MNARGADAARPSSSVTSPVDIYRNHRGQRRRRPPGTPWCTWRGRHRGSGASVAHWLRRVAGHERRCRSAPRRITPAHGNLVRRHLPDQWQDVLLQGHRGERVRREHHASAEVSATPGGLVGVAGRIDAFGRNSTNSPQLAAHRGRHLPTDRVDGRHGHFEPGGGLRRRREPRCSCAVRMAASGGSASSAALRRAGCHSAASSPSDPGSPARRGRRSACSCSGATRRSTGNESRARWRAASGRATCRLAAPARPRRPRPRSAGDQVRRRAGHDGRRVLPTVLGSLPDGRVAVARRLHHGRSLRHLRQLRGWRRHRVRTGR